MTTENNTTKETHKKREGGRPEGPSAERRGSRGGGKGRGHSRRRSGGGPKVTRRHSRRRRPLAHGDLRLLILNIISTTPSHGYGLINEIKSLTSGFYEPSPGVIYPALEALQDLGWAEVKPEKGKRILYITSSGESELTKQGEALRSIEQRLKTLASPEQEIEADDIRGALRQLKHTTVSIFKGKQVDVDIRKQAVTILEDARKKITDLP